MAVITEVDVHAAAGRLDGVAHRTPVLTTRSWPELYFKAECFQRTGSFKFRGAYNRLAQLNDEERARGVAASRREPRAGCRVGRPRDRYQRGDLDADRRTGQQDGGHAPRTGPRW